MIAMVQRKHIWLIATCALFFLITGCVEPFKPHIDNKEALNLLVVEGLISDQEGPFSVKLSSALPVYQEWNVVTEFQPVSGAVVNITDDAGNAFLLEEDEAGWYETDAKDLRGIPGNTYFLTIATPDGKEYESEGVYMHEVPAIDQVYHKDSYRTYFDEETPYEENWLDVMVDTRSDDDDVSYFKWEYEETWEMEMPSYVQVDHGTGEGDPPPSWEQIEIDMEKKYCWVTEKSKNILIRSTLDSPTREIKAFELQSIGPHDDRLNMKYSILVKQYVIDRGLYNFFKLIRESNEETGGIYEKAPVRIFGNIYCCNGGEQPLGYFMASAEQSKRIFIEPGEHHVAKGSAYEDCGWTSSPPRYSSYPIYGTYNNGTETARSSSRYCTDCRTRGSNTKPEFWDQ